LRLVTGKRTSELRLTCGEYFGVDFGPIASGKFEFVPARDSWPATFILLQHRESDSDYMARDPEI